MTLPSAIPRLAGIRLHPIKSLDPVTVDEARIGPAGGLEGDRVWTLHPAEFRAADSLAHLKTRDISAKLQLLNGKRSAAMHRIRAAFSPKLDAVKLSITDTGGNGASNVLSPCEFAFPQDTAGAAEWFSAYFAQPIVVCYTREGVPDDTVANGPTIISTATLQRLCEWFPGLTLDETRRRFRTTLEIDGVPAFWEDQLFGETPGIGDNMIPPVNPRFRIGAVNFEGSNPCARCSVPPRDSHTGEEIIGFQKRFSELRRAELPAWSAASRFDHFYRLAVNTFVAPGESGKVIRVGDELILL